jgi:hypothetical protein
MPEACNALFYNKREPKIRMPVCILLLQIMDKKDAKCASIG